MRSILVLNSKGGTGKTTVATNLAVWYALQDSKVALVDFDRQGSAMDWLETRPEDRPVIHGVEGWRSTARLPRGTDVFLNDGDGVGLEFRNGFGAEIHVVIRGHGPAPDPNDGLAGFTVAEQLSLFNGGCPDADGDPVDNCEDEQVFIFPSPLLTE